MKISFINKKASDDLTDTTVPRKTGTGTTLFDQGIKDDVYVFRACHRSITSFLPNDYVTRSKKFACGHADHQTTVNEEIYHVIYALVSPKYVKDAYNPGEYFWIGPEKRGKVCYTSELF